MSRRFVLTVTFRAGRPKPGVDKVRRHLARPFSLRFGRKSHTMVTDWNAKRSGASITLTGRDGANKPIKLTIREIASRGGKRIALATDGSTYELA